MTQVTRKQNRKSADRDSLRVLLALVFILFAALASRDHESPEATLEAHETAQAEGSNLTQNQIQSQARHQRDRDMRHSPKLPETAILSRISHISHISGAL